MYSPSQPELKREFKAAGTFSPPPDPGTMVAPPPSTGGHGFMHQRQSSFGGMGTPQPTRASIGGYNDPMHPTSQPPPQHQQHQQHQQQQQQQQQPPPPSWLNSHPYPSPHIVSPSNSTPHPTSIPSTKTSTSTASSNASAPHMNDFVNDDDETQQRHMQEIIEKRRRRRESHNLVERRRRDNINERIQELCTMLPQHLLDATTAHPHLIAGGQHRSPNTINKGTILRLSVEHIRQLQDQVLQYQARIKEMEQFLTTSKLVPPPSFADYPLPSSSQHPPPPFSSAFPNAM